MENPLCQDMWRAGHAHAGALLVLSLIVLRYVDEANLSGVSKWIVRLTDPFAAIILPAAFSYLCSRQTLPSQTGLSTWPTLKR
jgi:hypothetical protein